MPHYISNESLSLTLALTYLLLLVIIPEQRSTLLLFQRQDVRINQHISLSDIKLISIHMNLLCGEVLHERCFRQTERHCLKTVGMIWSVLDDIGDGDDSYHFVHCTIQTSQQEVRGNHGGVDFREDLMRH